MMSEQTRQLESIQLDIICCDDIQVCSRTGMGEQEWARVCTGMGEQELARVCNGTGMCFSVVCSCPLLYTTYL